MGRYLVYIFHKEDPSRNLRSGYYKIAEASGSIEAKRKGIEELVMDGKRLKGKTLAENLQLARVSVYKG